MVVYTMQDKQTKHYEWKKDKWQVVVYNGYSNPRQWYMVRSRIQTRLGKGILIPVFQKVCNIAQKSGYQIFGCVLTQAPSLLSLVLDHTLGQLQQILILRTKADNEGRWERRRGVGSRFDWFKDWLTTDMLAREILPN